MNVIELLVRYRIKLVNTFNSIYISSSGNSLRVAASSNLTKSTPPLKRLIWSAAVEAIRSSAKLVKRETRNLSMTRLHARAFLQPKPAALNQTSFSLLVFEQKIVKNVYSSYDSSTRNWKDRCQNLSCWPWLYELGRLTAFKDWLFNTRTQIVVNFFFNLPAHVGSRCLRNGWRRQ